MQNPNFTSTRAGGCACGAVRYRLCTDPMFVNCCHCKDCQRQTGSAFVINALIETDRIEITMGNPEPTTLPTYSGRAHDVYHCPTCLTALWSDCGRRPALRFVRVGTLDDPTAHPPDAHIFTRSKLSWVQLPVNSKSFEIFYDMETIWPADSLQRRRKILGG